MATAEESRGMQRRAPCCGDWLTKERWRALSRHQVSPPTRRPPIIGATPFERMTPPLRCIPLGGLGEIGRNMMAVECGPDILIVDVGVMFPENEMLGVDLVIPDVSYLQDRLDRIRGIVITHGHED